jgi:hypothetical protein
MDLLALLSSFLTGIGTLALALLGYFTVREMAEQRREMEVQRRESRQPDLLIPTTHYRGSCKNGWQWIQKTESDDVGIRSASIELRNVGLGPAKNVSVKWSFALHEAVKKINTLALEIGAKPVAEQRDRDLIVDGCLTLWESVRRSWITDCILPTSIQSEPTTISVPFVYTQLIGGAIQLIFQSKNAVSDGELARKIQSCVPPIDCELSFQDSEGRQYRITHKLECAWLESSHGEDFYVRLGPVRNAEVDQTFTPINWRECSKEGAAMLEKLIERSKAARAVRH